MSTNCVTVPLLRLGAENKNKTVISEKMIRDNLTKAQYETMKRLCWIGNNSIYGMYPRASGYHQLPFFSLELLWHRSGILLNEIIRTVKDGIIDFDILYESILFKNKFYNLYKIFCIIEVEDYPIYFLGDYSHLKYYINFRKLRKGVPNDFKYRASYNRSRRSKLV